MYLPIDTSKARVREAQNARNNRLEIVKALADGEIWRRDLFKWGLFTTTGMIAPRTASASMPRAPTAKCRPAPRAARSFGGGEVLEPMHRPLVQTPDPAVARRHGDAGGRGRVTRICLN